MKNKFVFKILKYQEWFNNKNFYFGSKKDINDGFIHLSTYDQVQDTYKIHYYAQKNLIIVFFYIKDLNNKLKWENSRNNQLFPHYYGKIKKSLMVNFFELKTRFDNSHKFPKDFFTGKLFHK